MQHLNKINAINAIIFAIILGSMSGEYLAAQHYKCDETKFLNDLKPLLLSEMGLKLTSTDSMKMRKAIEENVNHRSVVVQPNADSHFWEIDSIMSSVDYDAILSDLYESVLEEYKNTAACFKECVVPNYSYFKVERLKGSLWLDFDAPYIKPHFRIGCKFDYAIRITASDLPRRMDYTISDPTQWGYVWENDGKMYLFRNLITKEFHATNNSIKLPYDPDNKETKYNIGQTFWTFPIKDGKIIGAYVSFHFADIDVRPTIDLFNNTYIYPHVYLKKDYNKHLKYLHLDK